MEVRSDTVGETVEAVEDSQEVKESGNKRSVENIDDGEIGAGGERKKLKVDDGSRADTLAAGDLQSGERISEDNINDLGAKLVNGDNQQQKIKQEDGVSVETASLLRKKKCVLLLSYCGSGYNGMQRNPGVRTIEEDLTKALLNANAITEDASRNYGKMSFQRCARTDKGVSAARQVVSLKMVPSKELLHEINKHLEPQIRVFALKKVTRGFDCKSRCSSRTYEYLLPTFAFSSSFAHTTRSFRISKEIKDEINETLLMFKGTKNFHNFTSGKSFGEESSKRYMLNLQIAGEPFVEKDTEFLVLQVQGQSFMQHQIRKMIGLLIAIIRKCTEREAITRSFQEPKMDIPKAPGLGLILDQVHFDGYNKKFGNDKIHEPLEWSECHDKIVEFKKQFIYEKIIDTEVTTRSMMRWLGSLSTHTYSSIGMSKLSADDKNEEEKEEEEEKPSLDSTAVTVPSEESPQEPVTK